MTKPFMLAACLMAVAIKQADCQTPSVSLDLGSHLLQPDTAGQFIPILISNTLDAEINRGTLLFRITGAEGVPTPNFVIEAEFDETTPSDADTIFRGIQYDGPGHILDGMEVRDRTVTPASGAPQPESQNAFFRFFLPDINDSVVADGILLSLEVDTTGVHAGVFNVTDILSLFNVGPLALVPSTTVEGSITIRTPGDYDGNGSVGPEDYTVWQNSFGSTTSLDADGNGDSIVNAADYTVWRDNLTVNFSANSERTAAAVPEPATALLACGMVLPTLARRRDYR